MRDEGRPFKVGFQEQALKHSRLLRLKAVGSERWRVSVGVNPEQVGNRKTNKLEPLLKRRKQENVVKTVGCPIFQDKFARYLMTVQAATGV